MPTLKFSLALIVSVAFAFSGAQGIAQDLPGAKTWQIYWEIQENAKHQVLIDTIDLHSYAICNTTDTPLRGNSATALVTMYRDGVRHEPDMELFVQSCMVILANKIEVRARDDTLKPKGHISLALY